MAERVRLESECSRKVTVGSNPTLTANMNQKGFINILLIVVIAVLAGAGVFLIATRQTTPSTPIPTPSATPIPTPSPTLTPTPTPVPNGEKIIRKVGEKEISFLIQKINPDNVEGLWFEVYPIERPNDPGTPKTLYVGDDIGYACEGVSEKLISINFAAQTITFNKVVGQPPYDGGCPICLAGNSLIDTPSGLIPVKDLQVGMLIWTTDKAGYRISGIVTKTSKVPVPPTHQMVHLVLKDGRELFVSPKHPTVDGRAVGELAPSDVYNGVSVVSTERVPYDEKATYDILPSGDTGFYWANGILMGSTLR